MTVFYSIFDNNLREYTFTQYMGNIIFEDLDISYWAVPGTLVDDDENMI